MAAVFRTTAMKYSWILFVGWFLLTGCTRTRADPSLLVPDNAVNVQRGTRECYASGCHYQSSYEYFGYANDLVAFYRSAQFACVAGEKDSLDARTFRMDEPVWFCEGKGDSGTGIALGFPQRKNQKEKQWLLVRAQLSWDDKLFR
jgi:hypothetical protein